MTSLLGSLLPGLRELRAPMAAGFLWMATLVLGVFPYVDRLRRLNVADDLVEIVSVIPESLQWAAVFFLSYLIGVVATGLMRSLSQSDLLETTLNRFLHNSSSPRIQWLADRVLRPTPDVQGMIRSTIENRLRDVSRVIREVVPLPLVLEQFELAELRLSKDAPEQYQQYDRVRAEAEFRSVLTLPLLVFGLLLAVKMPPSWGWPTAAVSIAMFAGLGAQGLAHHRRADRLLASAIYFGFASTPILDALEDSANGRMPVSADNPNAEAKDLAWLADFLADRGMLGYIARTDAILRHPSREYRVSLDAARHFMKKDTKRQLDKFRLGHYVQQDGN